MPAKDIKIRSKEGGTFDCYVATPAGAGKVPAIVLASAVHGVDADMRSIADQFAAQGYRRGARSLLADRSGSARARRRPHEDALAAAPRKDPCR